MKRVALFGANTKGNANATTNLPSSLADFFDSHPPPAMASLNEYNILPKSITGPEAVENRLRPLLEMLKDRNLSAITADPYLPANELRCEVVFVIGAEQPTPYLRQEPGPRGATVIGDAFVFSLQHEHMLEYMKVADEVDPRISELLGEGGRLERLQREKPYIYYFSGKDIDPTAQSRLVPALDENGNCHLSVYSHLPKMSVYSMPEAQAEVLGRYMGSLRLMLLTEDIYTPSYEDVNMYTLRIAQAALFRTTALGHLLITSSTLDTNGEDRGKLIIRSEPDPRLFTFLDMHTFAAAEFAGCFITVASFHLPQELMRERHHNHAEVEFTQAGGGATVESVYKAAVEAAMGARSRRAEKLRVSGAIQLAVRVGAVTAGGIEWGRDCEHHSSAPFADGVSADDDEEGE